MAGIADAVGADFGDGVSFALGEEAFVVGHEVLVDLGGFLFASGLGFGEFRFPGFGAGLEFGDFFVDDFLSLGECFLGLGDGGAALVGFFHEFELLGFELVDHGLVAFDFATKFEVFVVFLGFELLVLELFDGGLASAAVEVDIFDGDLVLLVGGLGGGEGGFVIGEAFPGHVLLLGDALELVVDRGDLLVEVLNFDKLLNVFAHG